ADQRVVTAATDPRKDSRVVPGPSRASPSTAPSLKYESRPMADTTSAAALAVPVPTSADIERAKEFTREEFVYNGEQVEDALAPGSARRRALESALAELDAGAEHPSVEWRRQFSLLLGLERLLSEEEPHLADGTVL